MPTETSTVTRPPRERMSAAQRREAIIAAAMEEFAIGGLHGTATEAIARRVGVTQPYLFHLFGTKKDLFIATVRHCFDRTGAMFEQAAAGVAPGEELAAMGEAYRVMLEDRTKLRMQMHAYAACGDPDVRRAVQAAFANLFELIGRLSGASNEDLRSFVATGMLMNVAAAMDLPALSAHWAQVCCLAKED